MQFNEVFTIVVDNFLSRAETTCVALLKSSPTHDYRSDSKELLSLSHGVRPVNQMTSSILPRPSLTRPMNSN